MTASLSLVIVLVALPSPVDRAKTLPSRAAAPLRLSLLGDDEPLSAPWTTGTGSAPEGASGPAVSPLEKKRAWLLERQRGQTLVAPLVSIAAGAALLPAGIWLFGRPPSRVCTFDLGGAQTGCHLDASSTRASGAWYGAIGAGAILAGVVLLIVDLVQQQALQREIEALDGPIQGAERTAPSAAGSALALRF